MSGALSQRDADLRDKFEIRVSDEPGDFDVVLDRLANLLVDIATRELEDDSCADGPCGDSLDEVEG